MNTKIKLRRTMLLNIVKVANCLAAVMIVHTANVACGWIFHQPEEPCEIKKYRRF